MKPKKLLLTSLSLTFVFLFIITSNVRADITNVEIECPQNIFKGEMLEINFLFNYESESQCLYGNHMIFEYTDDGDISHYIDGYPFFQAYQIIDLTIIRPSNISFSYDTSSYLMVSFDLILSFRINYMIGEINESGHVNQVEPLDGLYSDIYNVTLLDINNELIEETNINLTIIGLSILSGIIVINKRKDKNA